jgi:hypothetical protein
VLAPHGKAVELMEVKSLKLVQPVGHRRAGDEEASSVPAGGSDAASLPRAQDEEPLGVKVPLVQVGTHLRSMKGVKRSANKRH